jgi:hypothetical protein
MIYHKYIPIWEKMKKGISFKKEITNTMKRIEHPNIQSAILSIPQRELNQVYHLILIYLILRVIFTMDL